MNEKPLVSVIVPSYNHVRFVEQTLHSILNQTYKNIELIVIDDGSTDGSHELLERLSKEHGFYYERTQNNGLPATLNKGMEKSTGKYIAFCASDDYWMLDKIEKQVKYMEHNPDTIACAGNYLIINAQNEILPNYFQAFYKKRDYTFYDFLTFRTHCPALTVIYRSDLIKKFKYDKNYKIEDRYMWLKLTENGSVITLLPDLLGFYRVHGSNTTKRNKFMLTEKLKILNLYKGKKGYARGVYRSYKQYYFHILLKLIPTSIFPFKRT